MPRKNCPYGYSCARLMDQPDIEAGQCPNLEACLQLANDPDAESYELQHVEDGQIIQRAVSPIAAASAMLIQRGNPQSFKSLGLANLQASVTALAQQLQSQLNELETAYQDHYIAPEGTEVHSYAVKRPYGKYWYNKLSAYSPMFVPQREAGQVRHIHLSKDNDVRSLAAKAGIDRRNRLTKIRTQLTAAITTLQAAIDIANDAET